MSRPPVQLADYLTTADPTSCDLGLWQEHINGIARRTAERFVLMCPEDLTFLDYRDRLEDIAETIRLAQRSQLERFHLAEEVISVAEMAIVDAFKEEVRKLYGTVQAGGAA